MTYRMPMQHDFIFGLFTSGSDTTYPTAASVEASIVAAKAAGFNAMCFGTSLVTDPTRMLQAAAFATQYQFPIIPTINQTCGRNGVAANPTSMPLETTVRRFAQYAGCIGLNVFDEPTPSVDETVIRGWVDRMRATDPYRHATGELFPNGGAASVIANVYDAILPTSLMPDPQPCTTTHGDMAMINSSGQGTETALVTFLAAATATRAAAVPFWVVPQAFGGFGDLRQPSEAEINCQFWMCVAAGASGVFWFLWDTVLEGETTITGIRDLPLTMGYLLTLSQLLTTAVRVALKRTIVRTANWTATNSCTTATLGNLNRGQTAAGARTFVVVYNPTTTTRVTGLAPVAGGPFTLTNLHTGASQAGVVGNTYSLAAGRGLLFEVS